MATTEQKQKLLKAKIAVALHDELGRVPKKEELDQVFLLSRVMYKAVLGLHFQRQTQKKTDKWLFFLPMICFHEIVFIDHQGKSCGRCGIALEGYGVASPFPGKQEEPHSCLHGKTVWKRINENEERCVYCSLIRKIDKPPEDQPDHTPFSKLVFFYAF